MGAFFFSLRANSKYCRGCSECGKFLKIGPHQQVIEIRKLPPETQIRVYLCVVIYRKACPDYLADPIAEQGKEILPLVLEQMRSVPDEYAKGKLFRIIVLMQEENYYDISKDDVILHELRKILNGLSFEREQNLKWLDSLKKKE